MINEDAAEAVREELADLAKRNEKFRVDVQGVGETTWASNALRFDTEEEADRYARDLYARWTGMANWRVVPESTPERETIVPEATSGS